MNMTTSLIDERMSLIYRDSFFHSEIVNLIINKELLIINSNIRESSFLGFMKEDIINKMYWPDFVLPDKDKYNYIIDLHQNEKKNFEYLCNISDLFGENYDFLVKVAPICNSDLRLLSLIDVSIIKDKEKEKFKYIELHDILTGLPNRKLFKIYLQIELQKAKRHNFKIALMCIGIANMKKINEENGLNFGDKYLSMAGSIISKNFREGDLTARLYGNKFIVLLADISSYVDVEFIIKKTLRALKNTIVLEDGIEIRPASYIGITIFPEDGNSEESLIRNSEAAMQIAKNKGLNSYQLFNQKLEDQLNKRIKLEKLLLNAYNNDEFIHHFQPILNKEGQIISIEVLIRWNNPNLGIIGPDRFIPYVEKNGMIIEIGYQSIRKVCFLMNRLKLKGFNNIKFAINISPIQFMHVDLVENIKNIIHITGVDPRLLELEITESGIIDDAQKSTQKLLEIQKLGISISIDDFGTGFSSLSRLKKYPVRTLKIDKSFIDDLNSNRRSLKIVTAIINLAHDLDFHVVAEGVETEVQFQKLIELDCDYFQGYLFYKPLRLDSLVRVVNQLNKTVILERKIIK